MKRVYCNGELIMTFDFNKMRKGMDICKEDELCDIFRNLFGLIDGTAIKNYGEKIDPGMEKDIDELWKGHENLRKLGEEKYAEAEKIYDSEDIFESTNKQFEMMKHELSKEDFKIWKELRNKEVDIENSYSEKNLDYDYIKFVDENGNEDGYNF